MKKFDKSKIDFFYIIKYMATYIVIVAVFAMLLSHLYIKFSSQVKKEALDNGYKRFDDGINELDTKISDMYRIASLIRDDEAVSKMAKLNASLGNEDYYIFSKAQKELADLRELYELESSVIFKNNDYFVANGSYSGILGKDYKTYADYEGVSAEEIRQRIFSESKSISYIPSKPVKCGGAEEKNAITVAAKMPVNAAMKYDCAVLFLIDNESIVDMVLDEKRKDSSYFYITDDKDEVILRHNFSDEVTVPEKNYSEEKTNGEKYYIFKSKAQYSNLTAVMGIPESAFQKELKPILNIVRLYIFIGVLLVIAACIYFATRQASFVKGAINAFPGRKKETGNIRDDYGYIRSEIKAMSEENLRHRESIERMRESIRNSLIEKVLMYGVYELGEKLAFEEYVGKHTEFYCLVSVLSDVEDYEERLNLSERIKNIYEDEFNVLTVCSEAEKLYFIIWLDGDENTEIEKILDFTYKLTKRLTSITACVSSVGSGVENIHICYHQTCNMLRQIFDPSERFLYFKKHNDAAPGRIFEASTSRRLSELVVIGEREEIKKLFARIKRNLRLKVMENEQEIMQLFFEIKSPLDEIYTNVFKKSGEREIPQYKSQLHLNDMIDELEDFSLYLCDCMAEKKRSKKEELRAKIAAYIEENYHNSGLCAQVVADEFSLSEKYVYSVVKEHTGKTFNEFLESIRLEKAKEYLIGTDMAVNKIAQAVGFNAIDTFYKAFKRVHSVAPGKWKESNSKNISPEKEEGEKDYE